MSGLLNKLADQLSGQKPPQGSQPSSGSGMLHKVTDAVTGQKHAQDYPNQQASMNAGYGQGYPGQQHGFEQRPGQPTPYGYGSGYPQGGHNS